MNNRILAMLLAIVLLIGIVPVTSQAVTHTWCIDFDLDCACDYCAKPMHEGTTLEHDEYGHWIACARCGEGESDWELHYYDALTNDGNGNHSGSCIECGYQLVEEHIINSYDCSCYVCGLEDAHTTTDWALYPSENSMHFKRCTVCNQTVETEKHEYAVTAKEYGVDTHKLECADCGYATAQSCTDAEGDCLCDKCGALMTHYIADLSTVEQAATCTETGLATHYACGDCQRIFKYEGGVCTEITIADVTTEPIGHDESVKWFSDDSGHWHVCKNEGCEDKLSFSAHAPGAWKLYPSNNAQHFQQCTVCYKTVVTEDHKFTYTASEYGVEKHKAECADCGYVVEEEACTDEDGNHYCDNCNVVLKHTEDLGCMELVHKTATCTEDGLWLHYRCTVCGLRIRDGEIFPEDAIVNPASGHDYQWNHNNEEHWSKCTKCDDAIDREAHPAASYVCNDGEGTHTLECAECGRGPISLDCVDENADCTCDICGGMMVHVREGLSYTAYHGATCTEAGNHGYFTCDTCGVVLEKDDAGNFVVCENYVIDALGHDWQNVGLTASGKHQQQCTRCELFKTSDHMDEDADCYCDAEGCDVLVHSHKFVIVNQVDATCTEDGTEAYLKYEDCGKMFDLNQAAITAPAVIPATGHDWSGEWVGVDTDNHALVCANCDETQTEEHADENEDNVCDVCDAVLELTYVPQVDPTCTAAGYEAYWISEVTGRKYADEAGTTYIASVERIAPLGHDMGIAQDNGIGGHTSVCQRSGCEYSETYAHTNVEHICFCDDCGAVISGHNLTLVDTQKATCTKAGYLAYIVCDCGRMYDALTGSAIEEPEAIPATGHSWTANWKENKVEGNHEKYCVNSGCDAVMSAEHQMVLEDPLKGNYHQWICVCGSLETEIHYDNDGDTVCDECGHDLAETTLDVQQHGKVEVTIGDSTTANNGNTWWQDWWSNLFPSYVGEADSSSASGSTGTTGNTGTTGSTGSAGSTGSTGNTGSTGTIGSTGSTSTATVADFFQWLAQLFNAWMGN